MLGHLFLTEENLQIGTSPFKWCSYRCKRWSAPLTRRPYWFSQKELITWLASGKLIVQKNQSYESYKIRIRSLLIVFPAKTRSAKLPLYISQRIALVVSCPYISKKSAGWVIRPRSGAATLKATGAPSQDGPFTRHRILVPTILDLLNSEQPLGQLNFGARSTDKIAYQSQALAI